MNSVFIQAQRTELDRADKLMEILQRADDSNLPQFYEALMTTNQRHVIDLMNFKGLHLIQTSHFCQNNTEVSRNELVHSRLLIDHL